MEGKVMEEAGQRKCSVPPVPKKKPKVKLPTVRTGKFAWSRQNKRKGNDFVWLKNNTYNRDRRYNQLLANNRALAKALANQKLDSNQLCERLLQMQSENNELKEKNVQQETLFRASAAVHQINEMRQEMESFLRKVLEHMMGMSENIDKAWTLLDRMKRLSSVSALHDSHSGILSRSEVGPFGSSPQSTPPKQVVSPMVSGHTIKKPTITLKRMNAEEMVELQQARALQRPVVTRPFDLSVINEHLENTPEERTESPLTTHEEELSEEEETFTRRSHSVRNIDMRGGSVFLKDAQVQLRRIDGFVSSPAVNMSGSRRIELSLQPCSVVVEELTEAQKRSLSSLELMKEKQSSPRVVLTDSVRGSISPIYHPAKEKQITPVVVETRKERSKTPVVSLKDVSPYLQNSTSISVQKLQEFQLKRTSMTHNDTSREENMDASEQKSPVPLSRQSTSKKRSYKLSIECVRDSSSLDSPEDSLQMFFERVRSEDPLEGPSWKYERKGHVTTRRRLSSKRGRPRKKLSESPFKKSSAREGLIDKSPKKSVDKLPQCIVSSADNCKTDNQLSENRDNFTATHVESEAYVNINPVERTTCVVTDMEVTLHIQTQLPRLSEKNHETEPNSVISSLAHQQVEEATENCETVSVNASTKANFPGHAASCNKTGVVLASKSASPDANMASNVGSFPGAKDDTPITGTDSKRGGSVTPKKSLPSGDPPFKKGRETRKLTFAQTDQSDRNEDQVEELVEISAVSGTEASLKESGKESASPTGDRINGLVQVVVEKCDNLIGKTGDTSESSSQQTEKRHSAIKRKLQSEACEKNQNPDSKSRKKVRLSSDSSDSWSPRVVLKKKKVVKKNKKLKKSSSKESKHKAEGTNVNGHQKENVPNATETLPKEDESNSINLEDEDSGNSSKENIVDSEPKESREGSIICPPKMTPKLRDPVIIVNKLAEGSTDIREIKRKKKNKQTKGRIEGNKAGSESPKAKECTKLEDAPNPAVSNGAKSSMKIKEFSANNIEHGTSHKNLQAESEIAKSNDENTPRRPLVDTENGRARRRITKLNFKEPTLRSKIQASIPAEALVMEDFVIPVEWIRERKRGQQNRASWVTIPKIQFPIPAEALVVEDFWLPEGWIEAYKRGQHVSENSL